MPAGRFVLQERTAALLERAYRMALMLQSRVGADSQGVDAEVQRFEQMAVTAELVAVLDEARAAWVDPANRSGGRH